MPPQANGGSSAKRGRPTGANKCAEAPASAPAAVFAIGSRVRVEGLDASAIVQMETSTQLLVRVDGREMWLPRHRARPEEEVRASSAQPSSAWP